MDSQLSFIENSYLPVFLPSLVINFLDFPQTGTYHDFRQTLTHHAFTKTSYQIRD